MTLREKAKEFATSAHAGQVRKSSKRPYITHPIAVAKILADAGFRDEVVCAGYLHDTVEDTPTTIEDIALRFGEDVADLVQFNTEDKLDADGNNNPWKIRKQHTIDSFSGAPLEKRAMVIADKLDNLRQLVESKKTVSEEDLWKPFKVGRDEQFWYFSNTAKEAIRGLKENEIPEFFFVYKNLVEEFFDQPF